MLSRIVLNTRRATPIRYFSGSAKKILDPKNVAPNASFREKSFKEAWLSDEGAYPVMFVIGFAVIFSFGTGFLIMGTHPDARWSPSSRKSIFRGELRGAEFVKE